MYVAGMICIAVGLKKLLSHPGDTPGSVIEWLLAPVAAAAYLAGFAYVRWRMFGRPRRVPHHGGADLSRPRRPWHLSCGW